MMSDVKLYLGDCLEILPTLEAGSVDAIITDIPYGTTACSWDVVIPFEPMWREVKRILKSRGVFVTTASQPFTSRLVISNLDWFKYEWIWEKDRVTGALLAKIHPLKAHENILIFSKNGHIYNPQKTTGHPKSHKRGKNSKPPRALSLSIDLIGQNDCSTSRYPRTIQKFNVPNHGEMGLHPTQKPIKLYEYLVHTYTNISDNVLDIAMGSGTTGVACVQTNRNFIGIEIEPKYFEIAEKRIKEAQMQLVMDL